MPADLTAVKTQFAASLVVELATLDATVRQLEDMLQFYFDTGMTFGDADFANNEGLKHITAANFTAVLSSIEAVKTLMAAGHRTNINKVSRGV